VGDLEQLKREWENGSTISTLQEYIYVRERNAKFHLMMSDMWRQVCPVVLPFAQPDVAEFFYSLPDRYREGKKCTYMILDSSPQLSGIGNVSSSFRFNGLGSAWRDIEFKTVAKINNVLQGRLEIPFALINRYETEDQARILRFSLAQKFNESLSQCAEAGLINLDHIGARERKVLGLNLIMGYQLISSCDTTFKSNTK
jgi:hypothetical protein